MKIKKNSASNRRCLFIDTWTGYKNKKQSSAKTCIKLITTSYFYMNLRAKVFFKKCWDSVVNEVSIIHSYMTIQQISSLFSSAYICNIHIETMKLRLKFHYSLWPLKFVDDLNTASIMAKLTWHRHVLNFRMQSK